MQAINLNYHRYGSGKPIIILHGLFGSQRNWETVSEALSSRFTVYALDLRNHGDSPHGALFTNEVMAEDVKWFVERQRLQNVVIIGHSLGGKTAMIFACSYPQMIDKLIVVDMAPKAYPPESKAIMEAMMSVNLVQFTKQKEIIAALEPQIPDLSTRYFLAKNLERDKNGKFVWKINLKTIYDSYDNLRQALPNDLLFNKPTLFIRGEDSNYILDRDISIIKTHFPKARIETIPNSGHWVHIDAPDEFVRIVQEFSL